MADLNSMKTKQTVTLFSMFPELIPMENLKYVNIDRKFVFRKISSSTPGTKVKILHNKLGNTNPGSKHFVNSERLQNTIFKVSSTTKTTNGGLLFTNPAAN